MQPGAKARPRFITAQLTIGAQKRLLHHVLGILLVAGHPKSQTEDISAVALHEHAKCVAIARQRALDRARLGFFHPAFRLCRSPTVSSAPFDAARHATIYPLPCPTSSPSSRAPPAPEPFCSTGKAISKPPLRRSSSNSFSKLDGWSTIRSSTL